MTARRAEQRRGGSHSAAHAALAHAYACEARQLSQRSIRHARTRVRVLARAGTKTSGLQALFACRSLPAARRRRRTGGNRFRRGAEKSSRPMAKNFSRPATRRPCDGAARAPSTATGSLVIRKIRLAPAALAGHIRAGPAGDPAQARFHGHACPDRPVQVLRRPADRPAVSKARSSLTYPGPAFPPSGVQEGAGVSGTRTIRTWRLRPAPADPAS